MSQQELVMEADYDDFVIVEKYLNAMPRQDYQSTHALDMKLIQKGQLDPIKVNRKMWILDGYTRHDLLGQRGKKIKYVFMDFDTEEEEFEYVVECNVMRRQLSPFQRVEAMYGLFKTEREARNMAIRKIHYDVIYAIKDGMITAPQISKYTKYTDRNIRVILEELTNDYCVSREKKYVPHNGKVGGTNVYFYKLMPKAEAMMAKPMYKKTGQASLEVGKIIGVARTTVERCVQIIESGNMDAITKVRSGEYDIQTAWGIATNQTKRIMKYKSWRRTDKIKCPCCNQISLKKDFIVIRQ